MRFNFDPDYLIGAIVLAVLGLFAVGLLLWVGLGEIAFWRHPLINMSTGYHVSRLIRFVAILLLAIGWVFIGLIRRKNDG